MLCRPALPGLTDADGNRNDVIWSPFDVNAFQQPWPAKAYPTPRAVSDHQTGSWRKLLDKWLAHGEVIHQRAALRDLADDPHLLADLGLTREQAIEQGTTPFWH
jgi:uncharacterized protein YjiS (DUF1127 family)